MDKFEVYSCNGTVFWPHFAAHHYMTAEYNGHTAVVGLWNGRLSAFASCISYPSGTIKQPSVREHRTVVLPDFQGLGLGARISDTLAAHMLSVGVRYFVKTRHTTLGEYRNRSPLWRKTQHYGERKDKEYAQVRWKAISDFSFCHEFIGSDPAVYEKCLNNVRKVSTQLSFLDFGE